MTFSGQALLVTDARNKALLPLVIRGLYSLCGVTDIVIIRPLHEASAFRVLEDTYPRVTFLSDSDVLTFDAKDIAHYGVPNFPKRAGWFFQQFLKLGFSSHPIAKQNYLVWDADTVPLSSMEFCSNEKVIFTHGLEFFSEYFETIEDIFGFKSVFPCSVISQHSLFDKTIITQMFAHVTARLDSSSFYESVLTSCARRQSAFFSEYEVYAAFFAHCRPTGYSCDRRRWFRNAAALSGIPPSGLWLSYFARFFDYAAFESWDKGFVRTIKSIVKLTWAVLLPKASGLHWNSRHKQK